MEAKETPLCPHPFRHPLDSVIRSAVWGNAWSSEETRVRLKQLGAYKSPPRVASTEERFLDNFRS